MIPKDRKLSSTLVKKTFKEGKSVFGDDISLIFTPSGSAPGRFGVSVSSRAAATAVRRNSARRKSYRALQSIISDTKGSFASVFVIKRDISSLADGEVAEKMSRLLSKAGLIASTR